MERPDAWTDGEVNELLETTLSERTLRFGVTRSDVAAVAWMMDTMTTGQQQILKPAVTYALMRVLQVDHDDIKDEYLVDVINDCFALIPEALVDKAMMMQTFSVSVIEYCLTRCGKDALEELGWERVEDDDLREAICPHFLIETFFDYFQDEYSTDDLASLLFGFQTGELQEVVEIYCDSLYMGPSPAEVWKSHIARSFWTYWHSIDFSQYLPFLRMV
jgi:hypothetical protein